MSAPTKLFDTSKWPKFWQHFQDGLEYHLNETDDEFVHAMEHLQDDEAAFGVSWQVSLDLGTESLLQTFSVAADQTTKEWQEWQLNWRLTEEKQNG